LRVQALLKCYFGFVITYERESGIGLLARIEVEIEKALLLDRNLINDSFLSIVSCNRVAMGDRLVERKITRMQKIYTIPMARASPLRLLQSFVAHPDRLHTPKYAFLTVSSSWSSPAVPLRVTRPTSRI